MKLTKPEIAKVKAATKANKPIPKALKDKIEKIFDGDRICCQVGNYCEMATPSTCKDVGGTVVDNSNCARTAGAVYGVGTAAKVTTYRWVASSNTSYFKNNSKKKVRVDLKSIAGVGDTIHLAPRQETAAFLKSFEVPYQANYE